MAEVLSGRPEIGKFYMVPCIKVDFDCRSIWMDVNGWVPVLGPKHADGEYLKFEFEHWHIDWRFVGWKAFSYATDNGRKSPLSRVLTSDTTGPHGLKELTRSPVLRRIKCKRAMPEFPVVSQVVDAMYDSHGRRWHHLERAQAITCNRLKPGNICPHRGIDLTPFIRPDGTVTCPGHGLRWNTATGELLPFQESPW